MVLEVDRLGDGLARLGVRHLPPPVNERDPLPDPLGGGTDLLLLGLGEASVGVGEDVGAAPLLRRLLLVPICRKPVRGNLPHIEKLPVPAFHLPPKRKTALVSCLANSKGSRLPVVPSLPLLSATPNISFLDRGFQGKRSGFFGREAGVDARIAAIGSTSGIDRRLSAIESLGPQPGLAQGLKKARNSASRIAGLQSARQGYRRVAIANPS